MPDQISMKRYKVESVSFTADFSAVLVQFADPEDPEGPVIQRRIWDIDLRADEEMRTITWEIVDLVCDVLDRAHAANRSVRTPT